MEEQKLQDADLGASKPVPYPQFKQKPVQHPTVTACGHKLPAGHFPAQANCYFCWYALLESNPQALAQVHNILTEQGTPALERMYGRKFVKQFARYLREKLLTMHEAKKIEAEPIGPRLEIPSLENV
jgi:hypothetical protein